MCVLKSISATARNFRRTLESYFFPWHSVRAKVQRRKNFEDERESFQEVLNRNEKTFFLAFPFFIEGVKCRSKRIWSAFSMKSLTFLQQFRLLGWLYLSSVSFTILADEIPSFPYFASNDRKRHFIKVQGTLPVFWNADLGIHSKRRFLRNRESHETLICFNSTVLHRIWRT